jgi:ATP-dependent DNA ligase
LYYLGNTFKIADPLRLLNRHAFLGPRAPRQTTPLRFSSGDDHDLDYYGFEGIIPAGHYGAGPVVTWDEGTYSLLEVSDPVEALERGKLTIELQGKILRGVFTLVKMKGRGEKNWLLIKKKDAYSRDRWTLSRALTKEKASTLKERVPPCKAH